MTAAKGQEDIQMRYRTETDSIGSREVPEDAYYGIQSMRAAENFRMTGLHIHPEMVRSMADVKAAAATANYETGALDEERERAILHSCAEMREGKFDGEIIVDPIQGGAGTSLNMNVNEVLANRAIELLGGVKGDYKMVHPNDHPTGGRFFLGWRRKGWTRCWSMRTGSTGRTMRI